MKNFMSRAACKGLYDMSSITKGVYHILITRTGRKAAAGQSLAAVTKACKPALGRHRRRVYLQSGSDPPDVAVDTELEHRHKPLHSGAHLGCAGAAESS